ncbi:MAG: TrkA family potassium uptake protein [Spirochaetes bacterium]|nr:TrkA family potassium uptake protein [Spirochaetota bacterium]
MKKFVAIGLGNFGLTLAKSLVENGCEVLGVDASRDTVNQAKEFLTHAIIGDASKREVLAALSLKDFDGAVVSIGQEMAPSILISLYLKEIGVKRVIVRAISDDHGKILSQIGVTDVIFPERDMAVKLAGKLALKNAVDYLPLGEDIGIVEVVPPGEFLGKSLKELKITSRFNCQVIGLKSIAEGDAAGALEREATTKFTPSADDIITESTMMILIGKLGDIERIQALSKR